MTPTVKKTTYYKAIKLGLRNAVLLTSWWTDGDFMTLVALCERLKMDAPDLLVVLLSESGLKPSARASTSAGKAVAVGLNQMNIVASASAGLIPKYNNYNDWTKFADIVVAMSPSEQLTKVMEPFFNISDRVKAGKPWPDAMNVYAFNAAGFMSDISDNTVVYKGGTPEYDGNRGLDLDDSGEVTGKDLRVHCEYLMTSPLYLSAFLRMGILAFRAGHRKGFDDGQARLASSPTTYESVFDPAFFAAAYEDGYRVGTSSAVGTAYAQPAYLSV